MDSNRHLGRTSCGTPQVRVGYLPQEPELMDDKTVMENIAPAVESVTEAPEADPAESRVR